MPRTLRVVLEFLDIDRHPGVRNLEGLLNGRGLKARQVASALRCEGGSDTNTLLTVRVEKL